MDKKTAIRMLGGTVSAAARALDITPSAVSQWPEEGDVPKSAENRVLAALARKYLLPELIGTEGAPAVPAELQGMGSPVPQETTEGARDAA